MDPDANLDELLKLAAEVANGRNGWDEDDFASAAVRMAELVEALDGWITKGGFLPKRWKV